jgi:lysyl-tRNA synthetase class 2
MDEHSDLLQQRATKLHALQAIGWNYPNDFRPDAEATNLHARFDTMDAGLLENQPRAVRLAGRIMLKRVMGKATFLTIQDGSGSIQLFLDIRTLGAERYENCKDLDLGDIIGVEGSLFKTRTGELTVRATELIILVKTLQPLPEKFHGLQDAERRHRERHLDLLVNPQTKAVFLMRSKANNALRALLWARGFLEVETPMMQPIPGGAAARPFVTHHNALDMTLYLRIAPELYLKRLVVGGLERVFELNRNFRNEGVSTRHNPEFTMLEYYQAYSDHLGMMALTESLIRETAIAVCGNTCISYQGESLDLGHPFVRLQLEESLVQHLPGIDPKRLREVDHLCHVMTHHGLEPAQGGAGVLQLALFEKCVEPVLRQPTFVTGYPLEVSPLARCNQEDPFLCDRFELFIAGYEVANGFSELNDPEEQARRFHAQAAAHASGDDEAMHYDADYIRALEHGLPPTGGAGLGVDRLVMLLADRPSIREVILFPLLRPEGHRAGGGAAGAAET